MALALGVVFSLLIGYGLMAITEFFLFEGVNPPVNSR